MKTVYAKDIKAMVKKFSLTENEISYLRDLSEQINKTKTSICAELQEVLLYGSWSKDRVNAVNALLVYFGGKIQKTNDFRMALDKTCLEIGRILKCGSYQVSLWLKGASCQKDRFGKYIECSDTFGLNYLEID